MMEEEDECEDEDVGEGEREDEKTNEEEQEKEETNNEYRSVFVISVSKFYCSQYCL